jgi:hypothetical protein
MADRKGHPADPEHPLLRDSIEREKQSAREMMQRYKNVFGSEEGCRVLGDILTLCHFGETLDPSDPVQVAYYNVGITILRTAGVLDPLYSQLGMGR